MDHEDQMNPTAVAKWSPANAGITIECEHATVLLVPGINVDSVVGIDRIEYKISSEAKGVVTVSKCFTACRAILCAPQHERVWLCYAMLYTDVQLQGPNIPKRPGNIITHRNALDVCG